MTVTHADGFPIDPVETDAVLVGMGERYDVLVTLGDGVFPLVALAEGKQAVALGLVRTAGGRVPPASVRDGRGVRHGGYGQRWVEELGPGVRGVTPGDAYPVNAAPSANAGLTPYHAIKLALPKLAGGGRCALVIGLGSSGRSRCRSSGL